MLIVPESIYGCSIILSLGNLENNNLSKKQEMWDLWIKYRNNCLNNTSDKIYNILKVTYPLKEYNLKYTQDNWGCVGDVELLKEDISLINKEDIYSPIKITIETYGNPPFKWCEYMGNKGFIVDIYFLNLDDREKTKNNCGKCVYTSNYTHQLLPSFIPNIDEKEFKKLYINGRYKSIYRMIKYSKEVYDKYKICKELCEHLDLWGAGPKVTAIKNFIRIDSFYKVERLEDKIEKGIIVEGEFIKECNKIKCLYDNFINN